MKPLGKILNENKTISLIEKFMQNLDIEGICGFWIDEELDIDDKIWVYIVLDLDWIKSANTKPEFIAKRMRLGVQQEIKKFLGLDVMVGSTSRVCSE